MCVVHGIDASAPIACVGTIQDCLEYLRVESALAVRRVLPLVDVNPSHPLLQVKKTTSSPSRGLPHEAVTALRHSAESHESLLLLMRDPANVTLQGWRSAQEQCHKYAAEARLAIANGVPHEVVDPGTSGFPDALDIDGRRAPEAFKAALWKAAEQAGKGNWRNSIAALEGALDRARGALAARVKAELGKPTDTPPGEEPRCEVCRHPASEHEDGVGCTHPIDDRDTMCRCTLGRIQVLAQLGKPWDKRSAPAHLEPPTTPTPPPKEAKS